MPLITRNGSGEICSSIPLNPGIYYSTAIALAESARENSIFVKSYQFQILKLNSHQVFWSQDIRVAFLVFLRFKNGEMGMFYTSVTTIDQLRNSIDNRELDEIFVLESSHWQYKAKAYAFVNNLMEYYQDKPSKPQIQLLKNVLVHTYEIVLCYMNANNQPIILFGESAKQNIMSSTLENCAEKEDRITACDLQTAEVKELPSNIELQQMYNQHVIQHQSTFFTNTPLEPNQRQHNANRSSNDNSCTIV